ncbi:DUF934 domain-containing protein [Siccirubricoccus sp. KC 17139]|uniref:DUF934 domain-containing protein n=1 Tax=Siccirubricoccus soli TaxID=2899147 RepID=A0ABT1DBV2_9PROT|nr:DUF934 domain-containing protein [Siccirubricoccus soli]MCO6419413.1 DUF934 domain-containing protein [Siccirubricoccus soli]MCP2685548.1 DUF934 domain-containing protein [Siccirubricoccus soli]
MPLLEDGRIIDDAWVRVADDAVLPDSPAIVTLARLQREAAQLAGRNAPLGVVLPPDVAPDAIAPFLDRLGLVVLELPKFRDGRAFTQARALREHHGFTGEIRAAGHVIPDQYAALLRCGVSTVAVPEGADPAVWDAARRVVGIAYQASVVPDSPLSLLRRKLEIA